MPAKSVAEVFSAVDEKLEIALAGARDVSGPDPARRLPGFANVVNMGVATTQALQGLRTVVGGFDSWYSPKKAEMAGDPLLRFFWETRIRTFHQGFRFPMSGAVYISHATTGDLMRALGPPPPNAINGFIGDASGGSGFIVRAPDGSSQKVYVKLEGEFARVWSVLPDPPTMHLGRPINSAELASLCNLYFEYLRNLVKEAKARFLRDPDPMISGPTVS